MPSTPAPAIFVTPDGEVRLDVTVDRETVWLSQAQLVTLFQRDQSVVARHISSVFKDKELPKDTSMQILHRTASGRPATLYNHPCSIRTSPQLRLGSPRSRSSPRSPSSVD